MLLEINSSNGCYVGETGRSLFERAAEHRGDAVKKKHTSHIFKHWAIRHPEMTVQPLFKFKVLRSHKTAMSRQIHEAIRISSHGCLNSKAEFRQNQIKRLAVNLTPKELKAVEEEAEKADEGEVAAMDLLSKKLNSLNKVSCSTAIASAPAILTPNSQVDLDSIESSELFTDKSVKRKSNLGGFSDNFWAKNQV